MNLMFISLSEKNNLLFFLHLFLKKIAEQDGGKHEVAVFATRCSNLNRMLPVCTDWEVRACTLA